MKRVTLIMACLEILFLVTGCGDQRLPTIPATAQPPVPAVAPARISIPPADLPAPKKRPLPPAEVCQYGSAFFPDRGSEAG